MQGSLFNNVIDTSCLGCGLNTKVKTPQMKPYGNFKKGILNIGEAPGEQEDATGKPFQGRAGQALQRAYAEIGIDLFEDCLNINAVNCRTMDDNGNNRTPTSKEIAHCRNRVFNCIRMHKPKIIVLLGNSAVQSVFGDRWKKNLGTITKWRGWTIPDRELNAWICPTLHPSYIIRQEDAPEVETVWLQDLERIAGLITTPFPKFENESKYVKIIPKLEIVNILNKLMGSDNIFIDIETTGLKPYNKDQHKIVCISICNSENNVYVLPAPDTDEEINALKDLLENPNVGKMAHNMKYEDTWLNVIYGISVNPWIWDSMIAAHILDNRTEISSLKFQVYVNFGVVDYDSAIEKYLHSTDDKNANSTNRVMELVVNPIKRKELFTYCGLGSLSGYRLAMRQMTLIGFCDEHD